MFFKRLELQGFKSFGNRTRIEFQPGFTIVVGPNGCGKSNVLDAIRWVLGETSAKSLRGGRMGDVIFRGSQSQKPAGLAQVTLTIDNSRGLLKLDQPEISITRRLFSTGDAEYQLNKVKCRQRDVHELLLDTGIGADGYAIIEQGQIGQMVSAKPSERRQLFEEAAGISRYKLRREETLRKLARTQDDLLRIQDIVAEVERQTNSLRNQARKALRYRKIKRRLHRLQQRLLVIRHNALSAAFEEAKKALDAANEAYRAIAAAVATADAEVETRLNELEAQEKQLHSLQTHSFELKGDLEREKGRVRLATQRLAQIEERRAAIQREMESHENRRAVLQGTLEALQADLAREQLEVERQAEELALRERKLEELRARTSQAERERVRLRTDLNEARQKQAALETDHRLAQGLRERLEADLVHHDESHAELAARMETVEAEYQEALARAADLKARLQATVEEGRSLADLIKADDQAKQELSKELNELTRSVGQNAQRLQALKELEESYEGFFRGVKEVMRAGERRELQGIVGVVSSLLRVPANLEIAIEVALGGDLQDIIMERYDDAKRAIEFLKRRDFGRATFLPLDFVQTDFNESHLRGVFGSPGVLGLGRDLVQYDRKIEPAVRNLFKTTVIVEHLDVAAELQRQGIRNRFVSLQGDVVNPGGALTGGSHQTKGLLSRSREIRDLADKVEAGNRRLAEIRQQVQEAQDRLGALYARAAELQAQAQQLQLEEARASHVAESRERERREVRNRHASAEARRTQLSLDRDKQTRVIEESDAALAVVQVQLDAAQAAYSSHEATEGEHARELQAVSEDVIARREGVKAARQRLTVMGDRLREMEQSLEQSASDQETRDKELAALAQQQEDALKERSAAEGQIGELARQLEETEAKTGALQADKEVKTAALRVAQGEVQRLLRDRNEADNAVREAEVKSAELRAQREYLDREAQEEFGQPIAQIIEELRAAEAGEAPEGEVVAPPPEEGEQEEEEDAATLAEDDAITDPIKLRALVTDLRGKLNRLGTVNEAAIEEYAEAAKRLAFLTEQRDDLQKASDALRSTIQQIDETTTRLFNEAMETIRSSFSEIFRTLFNGGKADLVLVQDEKSPEPGIDIYACPPGKNIGGSIMLMSGGEKALTAIALMFALFRYRPSPICILDEIDAPLDDVNVMRLCSALREYARETQFLIITHNKVTMQLADSIYGVTMQEPGVSKVVSVKFDQVEEQGLLEPTAG